MIILEALFPIILLISMGVLLKRFELTNTTFLQTSDRLVYYIFFPLMLFWKIGSSSIGSGGAGELCLAVLLALLVMFAISIIVIFALPISAYQAGSFAQSCYRFNTYIGVAVILNSFGEEGIRYFGIVIAFAIPLINVSAVATLIWFSQKKLSVRRRFHLLVRALVSNPLIIGCFAGLLYSSFLPAFPRFINTSLGLISMVTLPLALLSIGGSLSFSGIRRNLTLSFLSAGIKLMVFPLVGYTLLKLFGVTGIPFTVGMVFFALPTSTAIYILSSQMHSDPDLATSSIMVSTLLSFVPLSLVLLL